MEAVGDSAEAWKIFSELLGVMDIERATLVDLSSGSKVVRQEMQGDPGTVASELALPIHKDDAVVGELRLAGAPQHDGGGADGGDAGDRYRSSTASDR